MKADDKQTGISIRFIEEWQPPVRHVDFFEVRLPRELARVAVEECGAVAVDRIKSD